MKNPGRGSGLIAPFFDEWSLLHSTCVYFVQCILRNNFVWDRMLVKRRRMIPPPLALPESFHRVLNASCSFLLASSYPALRAASAASRPPQQPVSPLLSQPPILLPPRLVALCLPLFLFTSPLCSLSHEPFCSSQPFPLNSHALS